MKLDPIETFHEIGSGLLGRIFLFFAAGWVGLLLGRFADAFDRWSDFLAPHQAISDVFDFSGGIVEEILLFVFWPVLLFFGSAGVSCFLMPLVGILLFIAFFKFVQDDEPKIVWCLLIVFATTSIPMNDYDRPESWAALGITWAGLCTFSWWALQTWDPDLVEKAQKLFQKNSPAKAGTSSKPKKAPKNAWGKPVEGWDNTDTPESDDSSGHS